MSKVRVKRKGPVPRLEAGKVVGEEEHKKIIEELDRRRRNWR